jgi:hypothetical protein
MNCAPCEAARARALDALRSGLRGDWTAARQATADAAGHVRDKVLSEAERVRERLAR